MEDIQKYSEEITELMTEYQQFVTGSYLYDANRLKWKQNCLEKQRKIKNLLLAMKEEIEELPSSTLSSFNSLLKQHQTKLSAVMQEFQRKLKMPSKIENVRKEIPRLNQQEKQSQQTDRNVQSYFLKGDKEISRMKDAVQNMSAELEEGMALAEQVNMELNRQIQQLDNIEDKVKDTKSTLKRADRTIAFFEKAAQCDKCILGLVICIILAAIAFIFLLIRKRN